MQKYILIYLLFLLVTSCEKDKFEGIELSTGNEIRVSSEQQTIRIALRSGSDWSLASQPLGAGQARSVRHKEIHL